MKILIYTRNQKPVQVKIIPKSSSAIQVAREILNNYNESPSLLSKWKDTQNHFKLENADEFHVFSLDNVVSFNLNDWNTLQDVVSLALPYVTDILDDPKQLKSFKKGIVQKHEKLIQNAMNITPL